jgi:hypothetical protein
MQKLASILLFAIILCQSSFSQSGKVDSLFNNRDTTAVIDSLMKDFDKFLDSLSTPKSFFNIGLGAGTGFFSFENKSSFVTTTEKKLIISPSLGYFHKSGLGVSATAFTINDNTGFNFYQFALSPSYDLIKKKFSTGISYTRYINKDSLEFYTTPIQNELFAYFTYKKLWVRPTINFSYGWGSKASYEKQKLVRLSRLLAATGNQYYVTVKNTESVQDFAMTFSLRKNFDWYDVLGKGDDVSISPALLLNAGTQTFGFNTSYSYNFSAIRANSLPTNSDISDNNQFALQSVSFSLRGSYLKGKFLIQPQVLFDYSLVNYQDELPSFNTVFFVTVNFSF